MLATRKKQAIDDVSRLNGPEKAAVVLLALGEDHKDIWAQLDEEEIKPWAEQQGLPADTATLAEEPKVRELIQAEVDKANAKLAQVEQVKKFVILDHDLSQETGELTPTLKVKRNIVNEKYADLFEGLYAN